MKLGVFGNCQARGFAASLRSLTGHETHCYRIQEARTASPGALNEEANIFSSCEIVFTQPSITRSGFGPLDFGELQKLCPKVVPYPHIAYTGLQPDCHYIRPNGISLQGPMGPYHSAIAAAGFLEELPIHRTSSLFNKFTFASLGYLANDERSPLVLDSETFGYDAAPFIVGRNGVFMHTVNHPAINIVFDVTRQAAGKAGLDTIADSTAPRDELADSFVWPVYPGIAERIGLLGDCLFRPMNKSAMTLHEFVEASYETYRNWGKPFTSAQVERARQFIHGEVVHTNDRKP